MTQKLLTAKTVCEMLGGVSDMWLWRRLNDPQSQFPEPIYIARRRFWRESDILDWIDTQATKSAA